MKNFRTFNLAVEFYREMRALRLPGPEQDPYPTVKFFVKKLNRVLRAKRGKTITSVSSDRGGGKTEGFSRK